ncbi:MAG TPA: hypothetical protein VEG29_05465 [Candidatus Binatia bacterium]|nr:hypothetical protein [Candidatus Binatia bacterium]
MIDRRTDCSRYRFDLEAFVDRREVGPTTAAALAHLETCQSCEEEIEQLALAVYALRRLGTEAQVAGDEAVGTMDEIDGRIVTGTEVGTAGPASDDPTGWTALRARVDRAREPVWRWRAQLAGALVGAGLVAAFIGPASIQRGTSGVLDEAAGGPVVAVDPARRDILAEEAWMRRNQLARKESATDTASVDVRIDPAIFGEEARPLPKVSSPPLGPTPR